MNTALLFLEIILAFSAVVASKKFFGEFGLTAWVCVATITANVMTAKTSSAFGIEVALGTVLFASTFLSTDILCEMYGEKSARRAVIMGLLSTVAFTVAGQIALLYSPSAFDYADGPMHTLFGLNLRISLASALMYFVANYADVWLYNRLKTATGGKYMWLRNNISTALCNGAENFAFIFLAFYGIYTNAECLTIALSTTIIECLVAVCDTPFLYIATRSRNNGNKTVLAGAGERVISEG